MKSKNIVLTVLSILFLLLMGLLFLQPALFVSIIGFQKYSLVGGVLGSPFVGLANITQILQTSQLVRILINTLTLQFFAMIIGAAYVFAAVYAISVQKNGKLMTILAILFALPSMLPGNAYMIMLLEFLPVQVLTRSSVLLQLIAGAEIGLRFSAVLVIGALFTKGAATQKAGKFTLLYVSMRLLSILSLDTGFLNNLSNPLTYEHLDTYNTYSYRTGLMQSAFSLYGAGYVVRLLLQLLPAILGLFLLLLLFKANPNPKLHTRQADVSPTSDTPQMAASSKPNTSEQIQKAVSPFVLTGILPGLLFLFTLIAGADGMLALDQPLVQQAYVNGLLLALLSSALVISLGLVWAKAASCAGALGICFTAFFVFISDNILGHYIISHSLGLSNSLAGVLLQNLHLIVPAALIGMYVLKESRQLSCIPALLLSGLGLGFAWFWGDHMTALVTLRSTVKYPLSLMMQQLINGRDAVDASANGQTLTAVPYILIPVIVASVCIAVSSLCLKREQQSL